MQHYDVLGIGNAIVDILSYAEDEFVKTQGFDKGTMTLIAEARSQSLYQLVGVSKECSGGSVANTLAGMASLGSKTAFIGKVAPDQLGKIFMHDLKAAGVHYDTPPAAKDGPSTANCIVMVTPDAQRTMATYIGACALLSESDIDESLIARSGIVYIEGYLWNGEHNKNAIRKAIRLAHANGAQVAFTLSDTFCVNMHRAELLELVHDHLDILFANEAEIKSLFQVVDIEEAIAAIKGICPLAAITRGEHGSVVITAKHTHRVPTRPVEHLVDTTGAGDLFAAGFLHAHAQGRPLAECAELGNRCAGEIIQQLGARSLKPLKNLLVA